MIMIHDPPVQEVHLVWVVGRSMETVQEWDAPFIETKAFLQVFALFHFMSVSMKCIVSSDQENP